MQKESPLYLKNIVSLQNFSALCHFAITTDPVSISLPHTPTEEACLPPPQRGGGEPSSQVKASIHSLKTGLAECPLSFTVVS